MNADYEALVERRKKAMGPAYSHFYSKPLYLVRGEGVWVYDSEGRKYLDCYNNVPSVGHCHPFVVEALARQASTLNTHTRYLHHEIIEYAEMLAATLPGELSVCMLVCTGTEANDLAYRIARTVTGNIGAISTTGAYHGNSTLVSELSRDYGSTEALPNFVVYADPPYTYRGRYPESQPDAMVAYAGLVDDAIAVLDERGIRPAMMIVDSIYDGRGTLTPPPEYLQAVYPKVRAAGGLMIADEVQSGLTRLGDNYWGFMDSGVIPDIVTMGKPMGDGHPLAVVVTTPQIAADFAKRRDYFNTFGGNPVSAAVGKAVLQVVERENVLANVHAAGTRLKQGLLRLAGTHGLIGEVRGKGLFQAVELVLDRDSKEPARAAARGVAETLRERGVLVSTVGEFGNIVKIRPPLVFSTKHADILLERLDEALTLNAGNRDAG